MKKKNQPNALLAPVAISLTCLFLIMTACNKATAQQISILKIGFDQVLVKNNLSHAVSVQVGRDQKIVLSPTGSYALHFPLNYANVTKTVFTVGYDKQSFQRDSLLCVSKAEREIAKLESIKILLTAITEALHGTNFERVITLIRVLFCVIAPADCPFLIAELEAEYRSNDPETQKLERMKAIVKKYYEKVKDVILNESECLDAARRNLNYKATKTYYASQFIKMQERSRFEITPYIPVGFRPTVFRGVNYAKSISLLDYGTHASFGTRAAFNFNAYNKNSVRKLDTKYYIPVDFIHSRGTYRKTVDTVYKKGVGYSSDFYSIGFGSEFMYYNDNHTKNNYNVNIDVGIASNSLKTLALDSASGKTTSQLSTSHFKGFAPYINIGMKIKVLKWLDLSGSYYSTFLYSSLKYNKKDMPLFHQFNVGLNVILARNISYQY